MRDETCAGAHDIQHTFDEFKQTIGPELERDKRRGVAIEFDTDRIDDLASVYDAYYRVQALAERVRGGEMDSVSFRRECQWLVDKKNDCVKETAQLSGKEKNIFGFYGYLINILNALAPYCAAVDEALRVREGEDLQKVKLPALLDECQSYDNDNPPFEFLLTPAEGALIMATPIGLAYHGNEPLALRKGMSLLRLNQLRVALEPLSYYYLPKGGQEGIILLKVRLLPITKRTRRNDSPVPTYEVVGAYDQSYDPPRKLDGIPLVAWRALQAKIDKEFVKQRTSLLREHNAKKPARKNRIKGSGAFTMKCI